MSQFPLLGAGFIHPEISLADRQECHDRPTGEISGLERGQFRAFVKDCIRRFLIDVSRRGKEPVNDRICIGPSEEEEENEERGFDPPGKTESRFAAFDLEFVNKTLRGAFERLERKCTEEGKRANAYFDALRERLNDNPDAKSYAQIAAELGVTEEAVRVAHHRLRKRLIECLQEAVRDTTASEEDHRKEWQEVCEFHKESLQ